MTQKVWPRVKSWLGEEKKICKFFTKELYWITKNAKIKYLIGSTKICKNYPKFCECWFFICVLRLCSVVNALLQTSQVKLLWLVSFICWCRTFTLSKVSPHVPHDRFCSLVSWIVRMCSRSSLNHHKFNLVQIEISNKIIFKNISVWIS